MTFRAAKCPNCAGSLEVPDDKTTVRCLYCKSEIVVRDAIQLVTNRVREFTKAEAVRFKSDPKQAKGLHQRANVSLIVGGLSFVAFLFSFVALSASKNNSLIVLVFISLIGATLGLTFGLILHITAAFCNSNRVLGWIGLCPYCETQVRADEADKGLTCPACNRRIVFRDSKFISVDTSVGVARTSV